MAIYGGSIYGESFYGEAPVSLYAISDFAAEPVGYGGTKLMWTSPGGVWTSIRLVRNSAGYPGDESNGVVLSDEDFGSDPGRFNDSGLLKATWAYYSLFVFNPIDGDWLRSADVRVFVPVTYFGEHLFYDKIPSMYKSGEFDLTVAYDTHGNRRSRNPLAALSSVFGYQYDLDRNIANSALDFNNGSRVCYDLIPAALTQFGLTPEYDVGPEQARRLLRNAVLLYQTKGTLPGIHTYINALTGLDSYVTIGDNLLWDGDYSAFVGGIGYWSASALNCTVNWAEQTPQNAMQMWSLNGGGISTSFTNTANVDKLGLVVLPSTFYTAQCAIEASDLFQSPASLQIDWYDATNNLISSTVGAPVVTLDGVEQLITVSGESPVNAVRAGVTINVTSTVAGDFWFIRRVQFNRSSVVLPWQSGRDLRITLAAARVNEVLNSSFETGLDGWTAENGLAAAITSAHHPGSDGSFSALLTYTGSTRVPGDSVSNITVLQGGDGVDIVSGDGLTVYDDGVTKVTGSGVTNYDDGMFSISAQDFSPVFFTAVDTTPTERYVVQAKISAAGQAGRSIVIGMQARNDPLNASMSNALGPDSGTTVAFGPSSDLDDYVTIAIPFIAEANQTSIVIYLAGGQNADQFSVAQVLLEEQSQGTDAQVIDLDPLIVRPYFDGGTLSVTSDYMWEGVAFASRSHYYHRRSILDARLRSTLGDFLPLGATYTLLYAQPPQLFYVRDDVILVDNTPVSPTVTVSSGLTLQWRDEVVVSVVTQQQWRVLHS